MVQFVELPTRADALASYTAAFVAGIPGWVNNGDNDPLHYAAGHLIDRGHEIEELVNRTAASVTLGLATGEDLDLLLIWPREPGATDAEALATERERLALLSGFSRARLKALVKQVAGVSDASILRGSNYAVTIYIQGTGADGAKYQPSGNPLATDATLRTAVANHMNSIPNESWFADFTVAAETRTAYTVHATIIYAADVADLEALRTALADAFEQAMFDLQTLNTGIYDSDVNQRVKNAVPQVKDIALTMTPAGDKAPAESTVYVGSVAATGWVLQPEGGTPSPSGGLRPS